MGQYTIPGPGHSFARLPDILALLIHGKYMDIAPRRQEIVELRGTVRF
jgi:hypothetical protein